MTSISLQFSWRESDGPKDTQLALCAAMVVQWLEYTTAG